MLHFRAPRAALLLVVTTLACGDSSSDPGPPASVPVAAVRIEPGTLGLTPGGTGTLVAIVTDAGGGLLVGRSVTWTSSNPAVATVSGGVVTALTPGSTMIGATSEGRSGSATVTVSQPPVIAVVLDPTSLSLAVGAEAQVTATPTGAGGIALPGRTVTWTSSTPGVATVQNGLVRGVSVGSAVVTASSDGVPAALVVQVVAPPPTQAVFTTLASGTSHTCGLDADGHAWCWGGGRWGQTGSGNGTGSHNPRRVAGDLTFASISAEQNLTCALTPAGEAYCWGWNLRGSVGDGTTTQRNAPTRVQGGHTFVEVSAGGDHGCGRTANGRVYCWGRNSTGQIGDGTTTDRPAPVQVGGDHHFVAVEVGYQHSCGIDDDGRALCWGYGQNGALGVGNSQSRSLPTPVTGNHRFNRLQAAGYGTCAITPAGEGYCWGDSGMATSSANPLPLSATLRFTGAHPAWGFGCGVAEDGQGLCWGNNSYGVLGDGTSTHRRGQPGPVSGDHTFTQIAPGWYHACALDQDGAAWCWGNNGDGQIGDGTTFPRWTPTAVLVPGG